MKDFIVTAAAKATAQGVTVDPSPEAWAARAFSVIAVLGGMDEVGTEIGEILAECLAKAPNQTVADGTQMVIMARLMADSGVLPGESPQAPDNGLL